MGITISQPLVPSSVTSVKKKKKFVWLFPIAIGIGIEIEMSRNLARKIGCISPCDIRRSAGYGIEKIDFDSDPDRTISRQAMYRTLILCAGDACLVAAYSLLASMWCNTAVF